MFMLGLGLMIMSMRTGFPMSPGLIIMAEIMFMILLTYIRLLPLWIPIVIGIVGSAIAIIAAKNTMGG